MAETLVLWIEKVLLEAEMDVNNGTVTHSNNQSAIDWLKREKYTPAK